MLFCTQHAKAISWILQVRSYMADIGVNILISAFLFLMCTGTQVVASLESDTLGFSTIRHSDCELILGENAGIRCEKCKTHRKSLNSMLNRHQKGSPSDRMQPSSHANFSRLSTPEKIGRLHNLHQANRQLKQRLERLNRRITQSEGIYYLWLAALA